ncbi:DUF5805 domain-containing protein [Halorubrum sp. AD140]|uniref:DUF5805 domain-containing protein n=1 Tax=Halorubrum sp. AD140 TaxID=3050073 RepID=UPI002ACC9C56|nr:DUF5805 domain-containing protein [Halorubrum sp. AD140]MDZ5812319.1 DUF5805 domain-containing protein [Halorubrum sp. AD140]
MSDDRRAVKTYVPADQKDRWRDHADELGMSQSEFVRTMVQAGRRGFSTARSKMPVEPDPAGSDPRGDGLETQVEAALADGPLSWEGLVDAMVGDFEDRLEETLDALQDRNRVRYNGRKGGYTLTDE